MVLQLGLTKPLLSKLKLLKILLLALSFSFLQYIGYVFFTLLPVIKLIKGHWHGSRHISVIINETYMNLIKSLITFIILINRLIQI